MKVVTLSIKNFILIIGVIGSFFSIATYFITTQSYEQISNAENSPNIASNAPVTVNYGSKVPLKNWFAEYEQRKPNISKHQYEQIKVGMTYDEVIEVLKYEGTELSIGKYNKLYGWGKYPFFYIYMSFGKSGNLEWKSNSGLY